LLTMTQRPHPRYADVVVLGFLKREADTFAELATAKGIHFGIADVEPGLHLARFDPEQMGRALGNLILNAIQHTPGGVITPSVEKWRLRNPPTIRRLNPSCRHQLSRIAPRQA